MGLISPIGTVKAKFPIPHERGEGEEESENENKNEKPLKMVEDKVYYFRGY